VASKFAKKPTDKPHMVRTYKYDLILNQIEKVGLQYVLQTCQRLYNAALQERIDAYKKYLEELDKLGLYHYDFRPCARSKPQNQSFIFCVIDEFA